jgi:hypothetical protein
MHWLLIVFLALDLGAVKNEPNLERRSDRALDNANTALDSARDAYSAADLAKTQSALEEAGESVELAYHSLERTGKDARRSPGPFKRAELRTRELLRRLEGLRESFSVADRQTVDRVRDRVAEVHDDLLKAIMGKKRK